MTTGDPRRFVRVMDLVRAGIEDGTFQPGERVPSAGMLSVRTGFSRPTIAKALWLLQYEGLIRRIPGLGYYVTSTHGNDSDVVAPVRPDGPAGDYAREHLSLLPPPGQHPVIVRVAGEITDRVTARHWPPGTRLPAQRILAAEHSANSAIICYALMELAGQGTLLRIPGVGYFTPGPVQYAVPARAIIAVILEWDDGTRTRLTCTPAHQPPTPHSAPAGEASDAAAESQAPGSGPEGPESKRGGADRSDHPSGNGLTPRSEPRPGTPAPRESPIREEQQP